MPRQVKRIERKPFIRPIRKQLDQLAAPEEILRPERQDLGNAVTGGARAEHRSNVVHGQTDREHRCHSAKRLSKAISIMTPGHGFYDKDALASSNVQRAFQSSLWLGILASDLSHRGHEPQDDLETRPPLRNASEIVQRYASIRP